MLKLLRCRLWLHRVVLGGIVLLNLAPAPAPVRRLPPALELRRVLHFILDGSSFPDTSDALAGVIAAGIKKRLILPFGATPVLIDGTDVSRLQRMAIDFSHSYIDTDHRIPWRRPIGPFEKVIRTREFSVTADPMRIDGAAMSLKLKAQDVDLVVRRDQRQNPILVFVAAKQGNVELHTTGSDLSQIMLASANHRGKKYGLNVSKAILKLSSDHDRQLKADLRLVSTLFLFPVQIHMTARADVDDQGMVRISNLTCDGSDVAGWLISGMIRPKLDEFDGKTLPLVAFPSERVKVRDVRLKLTGDDIHIDAQFGT